MAQRRPIASHRAFAPLVALWFAALFGLGVAVLPAALVERMLGAIGLGALDPQSLAARLAASGAAALLGGLIGLALGRLLARRALHDPRPIYSEPAAFDEEPTVVAPARRPLHVREELTESFDDHPASAVPLANPIESAPAGDPPPVAVPSDEGFMILTPQPIHPPRPAVDLDALLAQFDGALAAFRSDDELRPAPGPGPKPPGPDPVHAFVARQTGTPAPSSPYVSPLGGAVPDHQAELRAALDKLARVHRKDD